MENNWIPVDGINFPEGKVLVQYLEPFFGKLTPEITVGYYDAPEYYGTDESEYNPAQGWKDWNTENKILVTHYMKLPEVIFTRFDGIEQTDFLKMFGTYRPNLGSVIETNKTL